MAEVAEGGREDTTVPCSPCTPRHRVCGLTVVRPPHASRTPSSPKSLLLPIISPVSIFPCLLSPAPLSELSIFREASPDNFSPSVATIHFTEFFFFF